MASITQLYADIQAAIQVIKSNEMKIRELATDMITEGKKRPLGDLGVARRNLKELADEPDEVIFLQRKILEELNFKKAEKGYHSPAFWADELREYPGLWPVAKKGRKENKRSEFENMKLKELRIGTPAEGAGKISKCK